MFLVCFVKSFYFVWCEVIVCSCQECFGEGAAVAVPTRWAVSMAKVAVRIAIGRRVVVNANVMSSSEYRSIRWATVYWISSWTIFPCLRQFNRCPSWFVHQWKQKGFGVVLVSTARSYRREIKDGTKCN